MRDRPWAGARNIARALAAGRAIAACCALLANEAAAIESLTLEIGDLRADFGAAEGIVLTIDIHRKDPSVSLRADALVLPEPLGRILDVRVDCAALEVAGERYACDEASATLTLPRLGVQTFGARFAYDAATQRVDLHAQGLEVARSRLELALAGTPADWKLTLGGRGLDAAALMVLAAAFGAPAGAPEIAGRLDLALTASGGDAGLSQADATLTASGVSGSDAAGRLAAESLALELELALRKATGAGWEFDMEAAIETGQLYVEPWFLEPEGAPLELEARGRYDGAALRIDEAAYRQAGVVAASGAARVALGPPARVVSARGHIREARFPAAYRIYLQPYLYGGAFDALATSGRAEAEFVLEDGGLQSLALALHDLHVDDTNERFAIYGLDGSLRWSGSAAPQDARLSWDGGFVYGIGFGAAALAASLGERELSLLEPLALPVLDGALRIGELAIENFGEAGLKLRFNAELEPIDMRALTAALGWPSFAGQLSGRIPDLSYDGGVATLGGDLRAEVFGGQVTVGNLALREPLGDLPRLAADVRIRGLDLDTLTDTFEIGRIEGHLDGDIDELRLFRWQPVAFDANFYTPPDDRSRHRISQRAVESLSSLGGGGGAAAALSSGFLRFFESFAYARLGLGCRLENEVCHMHGVAPVPRGGYYIVQGKWLPRIDVIGHADRVDWPVLVEQLESLADVDEAVVR